MGPPGDAPDKFLSKIPTPLPFARDEIAVRASAERNLKLQNRTRNSARRPQYLSEIYNMCFPLSQLKSTGKYMSFKLPL